MIQTVVKEKCRKEKLMTTKELAEQLGCNPSAITKNAKKCLPNKKIENGKPTYWNEKEITVLLDFMKNKNNRTDLLNLFDRLNNTKTNLSDDFEYFKLQAQKDLIQKQLDEYKDRRIAELTEDKEQLQIKLDESKEWASVKRIEIEQKCKHKYSWKFLRDYSKENGYEIQRVFDKNYGSVNAYHKDVWYKVYGVEF